MSDLFFSLTITALYVVITVPLAYFWGGSHRLAYILIGLIVGILIPLIGRLCFFTRPLSRQARYPISTDG